MAELLARYELPATFYVPRASQRPTMSQPDVRALLSHGDFEIGGHTLDHLALRDLPDADARQQVEGCKAWVEDVTGRACPAFCPPLGRFRRRHLQMIHSAGFKLARTVELLSLDHPRRSFDGLAVLPTSIQAYPHRRSAYVRNAVRRGSIVNLCRAATAKGDWVKALQRLLEQAARTGGVVHLWGHSWEIDETGQWARVEEALRLLRDHSSRATRCTNTRLVTACRPTVSGEPMALLAAVPKARASAGAGFR